MKSDDPEYAKRWDFLYYWIGEKNFEKLKNESNFQKIMHILDDVKLQFDNNKYTYDFSKISKNEFTQLKFIYDYVQDYETIQRTISQDNVECSTKISEHIKKCFQEYNTLKSRCTPREDKFCQIFKYIIGQNGNKELTELKCSVVKDAELRSKPNESPPDDPPRDIDEEVQNLSVRETRGNLSRRDAQLDLRGRDAPIDLEGNIEHVLELPSDSQDISPDSPRFLGTTMILTSVGILVPFYILKKVNKFNINK
ncbi:Plasmodium vivax Vir protein, putative [Plasmodium vivax]|uniref:Vir protein, putative n=1 Tax=Plasmodium vivax TaxID=5855 RepID=A0A1G4E6F9_PLAVI|nr:Plasmodium vivax Vir protein, putative [Plasmodium vivax]